MSSPDPKKIAKALEQSESKEQTPSLSVVPDPDDDAPVNPLLFTIRQLGRTLDDIERLRIMCGNRIGAGQRAGIELPWMDNIGAQLDALEHSVELELKRAWRKHPLAPWAKSIPGAGEVLMGRLIAEIGDPASRSNPAKLLAYCGHGDPARGGSVRKGATQEELFKRGSPNAKKATWKLAYQFMRTVGNDPTTGEAKPNNDSSGPAHTDPAKPVAHSKVQTPDPSSAATSSSTPTTAAPRRPRSPYRDIYDERKTATEGKLHAKECVRCGPAGHPALVGSAWSDAHRHADALRIVGKRFLIDLWVEARALQDLRVTQSRTGGAA